MQKDKTDFEYITDFANLYRAYRDAKSGKGFRRSSQRFQTTALDGILQIKNSLENKTYKVSKQNEFVIHEPKKRVIKAGSFVDKIVQHSLCDNVLLPRLKEEFITNNFAGQEGKGTLFGLNTLRSDMLTALQEYGRDCWIVKADISKFFYTINHEILTEIVREHIADDDVFWLCKTFIDSTDGDGIPLGNQVSQVFALLYLSGLDHFVTDTLRVKYYGRQMDDFYLIVKTKAEAQEYLDAVRNYVEKLKLSLNGKTQIIPFRNGIKFCGFHTYITEDGKPIRKLTNEKKREAQKRYRKMARLVVQGKLEKEKFMESYQAWKNHISHGNCIKLGFQMDHEIEMIFKEAEKL